MLVFPDGFRLAGKRSCATLITVDHGILAGDVTALGLAADLGQAELKGREITEGIPVHCVSKQAAGILWIVFKLGF